MNNECKIVQVERLDNITIHRALEDAVNEINWRIHSKNFKELFIDISNPVVESIGISWSNPNHPTAKYINIISTDHNPPLMERLLENIEPHDKVIFSCWEDEKIKLHFIKEYSFKLFRKTYMERFPVHSLLNKLQTIDDNFKILSLQQVLENPLLEKDLFQLLKHNYEQTHLHNVVKDVSWENWREMLLNDMPDLNLSYVVVENDRAGAYIFVHQIDNVHYEIGWVGKRSPINLHGILKKQLIQLAANGVKTVEFEIDTTDYFAYEFSKLLELDHKKSWNSYILND